MYLDFFKVIGRLGGWLVWCQYNLTGWGIMFIYDMALRCI